MDTIKEKNKNIIKDIDSYLKSINEDRIELIFEYKTNQGDIEHQIGQYFKNVVPTQVYECRSTLKNMIEVSKMRK